MNIVQLFYARPHLGGSGIMSMEVAKELSKRGHNVHIVSYPDTYLTEEEKKLGLQIHPVERIDYPCFKAEPFNATLASQIVNVHNQIGRVDIIHANYAITHGEAALTAQRIIRKKGGDPKVVVTSHGSDIHTNGYHYLLAPTICDTLESADAITFVSKALQDDAKELFCLEDYGKVVYNFVDQDRFKPAAEGQKSQLRSLFGFPEDAFIVYHASNFRPLKQTSLLVEAANVLKRKGRDDIYFLLLGEGPEQPELEKRVHDLGLDAKVRFAGKQLNVLPYIQASDVGILASQRESFGLALLEPMACGLPVLGSAVGGIPEIIDHGKSGYLFKDGDVKKMSSYITRLADSPALREEMGARALEKASTSFSKDGIVAEYEQLYREVMQK